MITTLLDGLTFPEGPRWHDGKLWFSDFYNHRVVAVGLDGKAETKEIVQTIPSGLGWMPGGSLLIVSMNDRSLLRVRRAFAASTPICRPSPADPATTWWSTRKAERMWGISGMTGSRGPIPRRQNSHSSTPTVPPASSR